MNVHVPASASALVSSFLVDWHWRSRAHHLSSDADFYSALVAIITGLVVVLIAGLSCFLAGLLQGSLLLALTGKKRHLFWAVPALNAGLYFPISAYLLPATGPLACAAVGVSLAILGGLLAAAFLAPFQLLWRRARTPLIGPPARPGELQAPMPLQPLPANDTRFAAFRRGLAAPWEGFAYLSQHPHLWRYGLLPVLLNLLITGAVLLLLLAAAATLVANLHPLFPAGWGWAVVEVLGAIAFLVLLVGLALILWTFLQGILCGHFYTRLAREAEIQLGMRPDQIHEVSWSYQIADAGRDAAALVAINGGFLLLHIVPGVGSVVGVAGSLYFDCLLFGEEYFDYPQALRGQLRPAKKAFTRQHRFHTLGLGAAIFLANLVPIVGSVLLTTAVVGAVLLHGRIAPNPP